MTDTTATGRVIAVDHRTTQRGDPWAQVTFDTFEALLFPTTYEAANRQRLLVPGTTLTVSGQVADSDDDLPGSLVIRATTVIGQRSERLRRRRTIERETTIREHIVEEEYE